MDLKAIDPKPMHPQSDDDSTVFNANTACTPPETDVDDLLTDFDPFTSAQPSSSTPWPGSTFIIRSAASGHVITLLDGEIVLASPGGRGSFHWACVESKGWLGFRNVVSGRFLGHAENGRLRCSAGRHQGWENFCVRLRPDGGYVLLMTHFERLWHVGFKNERGTERLAKVGDGGTNGLVWEFIKV
jgi:hypothetical protein